MESKHTPGDWEQSATDPTWIMAGRIHVATIARAYDGDWSPANACLVKASPNMLASLSELVGMINRQRDFNDDGDGMAIARAEAAIAKALGK